MNEVAAPETRLESEVHRRRTFAIISHPDAGKTTITEKILYFGGAIREAGEVKGKSGTKAATSDWMSMERERGVSITSSVMQFDFDGLRVNLLDTPGHKDFGEDTYRTLHAADCAAMLIDAAKGVEAQTRKLYEVCRRRKMPIFTFANKMDREGKDPFALIDDVEQTLQMDCYPITWPIGIGDRFKGLYHRLKKKLYLYTKGSDEAKIVAVTGWDDPTIEQYVGSDLYQTFLEEIDLLESALFPFDHERFLAGELSPMTFGSAKQNWGVDLFVDLYTQLAPAPLARESTAGRIEPTSLEFSGFVFKIQANMDRKHRDRVAFVRIVSGRFERGMKVWHTRLGRELRLNYANQFLAQDRETVDEAFAGDIVGINDSGNFQIGDTVTEGRNLKFEPMPRFMPEHFARLSIKDALKKKALQKAVGQLVQEGTAQLFIDPLWGAQDPIIAVVGRLQFEVLLYRLNDEYGLQVRLDELNFKLARWPTRKDGKPFEGPLKGSTNFKIYEDMYHQPVVLLDKEWDLRWLHEQNPDLEFLSTSPTLAETTTE
jgi:peptide chain release factor 3